MSERRRLWLLLREGPAGKNLFHRHDLQRFEEKIAAYKKRGFGTTDDWEYFEQLYAGHDYARLVGPPGSGDKNTFGDLKVGDKFIFFPQDGDNSGHGGYLGAHRVFVKVEPAEAPPPKYGAPRENAKDDRGVYSHMPDTMHVIKISWDPKPDGR